MVFCIRCNIMMDRETSGVTLALAENREYMVRGDTYVCPDCGIEVVADFGRSYHDPDGEPDYRPFSRT